MRGSELEAILVELSVSAADVLQASFASMVTEAADRTRSRVLFDLRSDGDPDVQRVAAIASGDDKITFVLLARDGTRLAVASPEEDLSDFIAPLSSWYELSLHERAVTPYLGHMALLLGALRTCGWVTSYREA